MHPTIQRLLASVPVVTDGAHGTQLQAAGLRAGECPDSWNLLHPERVGSVAAAYADAGSRVVLTNTFRSNRIALAGHGLGERVSELNRAGVRIARAAVRGQAAVVASVGPSGRMLFAGDTTREELSSAFTEQVTSLVDADAILLETFTDLAEVKIALASALATGLPVIVSMVFDSGRASDHTMTGATPEDVARELTDAGADVIGANCGLGMDGHLAICERLHAATDRPIWIKPNAGLPVMVEGKPTYTTSPEEFSAGALRMRSAGASFLGGCCGTTPDHIRSLARALSA